LYCISPDDGTDTKYQCDNKKQKLATDVSRALADRRLREVRVEYSEALSDTAVVIEEHGSDEDRQRLQELQANEVVIESSNNVKRIESEIVQVYTLYWSIQMRRPEILQGLFVRLSERVSSMNQPERAEDLVRQGQAATDSADWPKLREVNRELHMLLPSRQQDDMKTKIGFS